MTNVPAKQKKINWNEFDGSSMYPLLKDVFGTETLTSELENIVNSAGNEMLFGCFGVMPNKSFLFTGQPGTGKTFSTKAIYNEIALKNKPDLSAMFEYSIGIYGTAYINMGAKTLQKFFDSARTLLYAPESPIKTIVYFFDEAEVLMGKRGTREGHKEDDKLLNTLMTNLQELHDRADSEYIIFATNHQDLIDKAVLRSGRIDKILDFPLPTAEARYAAFQGYINQANERAQYQLIRRYNVNELVDNTDGFNYADVEAVIRSAIFDKINRELRTKPKGIIPAYWIGQKYLNEQIEILKKRKTAHSRRIGYV
jgi:cell division protease FtsH